ncbi:helix-turn-helix domain-containing protein [Sinorhizobium meliloti]|nr:helix-turn-helix domain-containing protein [Sinorhizobium meliloti]
MLRAAREAVGRSQTEVAAAAGVSARTVRRMEAAEGDVGFDTLGAVHDFLETQGVQFLEPHGAEDWSLVFRTALAPSPDSRSTRKRPFDPAPGRVLRTARVLIAASQEALAEQANIAQTTVRRLEHSGPDVSPELAFRLQSHLQAVGVDIRKPDSKFGWRIYLRR